MAVVGILLSCSKNREDGTVFHESRELHAEMIHVNEIFSADFVTTSGNYFVISSSLSDTTLFLYDIPSLTFKNATGRKGGGPDDISTFPMFCHSLDSNFLYVRGYSPLSIKKISIQPQGKFLFVDEYKLEKYEEYNHMNLIKDSIFIYYVTGELAIKKYDLKNKMLLKKINLEKENHGESYYYSNRGVPSANDTFIIYPYLYKKQIDIYSVNNLKLVKRIDDGKQYPNVTVYDDKNIVYHYVNVYAGKQYFYVMYDGHNRLDGNFSHRTLEVYDYKGNTKIKYTFDIVPFLFAVDEENGYIYGCNSNYEDCLLRYKL
jgi:WD40 repeat protein